MNRFAVILTLSLCIGIGSSLQAQNLPSVGTTHTFEVATWNLKFFGDPNQDPPNDDLALDYAEEIIRQSQIDLWGVEEIREPNHFYRLLDSLGSEYSGQLGPDTYLRLGFIYKTSVITDAQPVQQILTDKSSDFAGRPPLLMHATVSLADTSFEATFIVLHMKARSSLSDYEKRRRAAQWLKTYIDFFLNDRPVFVLGDFNDRLTTSIVAGRPSPYTNFVQDSIPQPDPQYYFFPTLPYELQGGWSWCSNFSCTSGSMIDHILITDEVKPHYEPGSCRSYVEAAQSITNYRNTITDHLPVFARFTYRTNTAIAESSPRTLSYGLTVHPNPFHESLHLTFTLSQRAKVQLELFDLLGRRVAKLEPGYFPAGQHTLRWPLPTIRVSGVYILRLTAGNTQIIRQVIRQ